MKNLNFILITLGALVCLNGCGPKTKALKDSNGITHINMVNSHSLKSDIKLTDVGKKVKYIPLEYRDDCALSQFFQFIPSKDGFFFLTDQGLFHFAPDGKFIGTIGSKGKGPGEYNMIADFCVIEREKMIYALDMVQAKVLKYTYSGDFVMEFPVSRMCYHIANVNDSAFVIQPINFNGDRDSRFVVVNTKGDTLRKYGNSIRFTRKSAPILLEQRQPFEVFHDVLRFYQPYNDTICSLESNMNLKGTYIMDCDSYKLPKELYSNFDEWEKRVKNYYMINDFREDENHLFMQYVYMEKVHRLVYNKADGELSHLSARDSLGISNDLDHGLPFWPLAVYDNSKMVQVWTAVDFKEQCQILNDRGGKLSADLQKINADLKVTDNPVIQVVVN